jgi:hypothetical protein
MEGWSFGGVMSKIGEAAKTGLVAAKDLTVKGIETVKDPEFHEKVKGGLVTAVDATKKVFAGL